MNDEKIKIGNKLKRLRNENNITQFDFCKAIGIPQSTISGYELDKVTPSVAHLKKIAEYFHVSMEWLCEEDN